jgi:hypothetical protein
VTHCDAEKRERGKRASTGDEGEEGAGDGSSTSECPMTGMLVLSWMYLTSSPEPRSQCV